jgi:hypothetical protein
VDSSVVGGGQTVLANRNPTLSVAAGTGVRLTDRVGLTGEFRLRGHEWRFTETTTDLSNGLVWRFASF